MEPLDLPQHQDTYFTRKTIERALSKSVFSEVDIADMMDNLAISMASQISSNCNASDKKDEIMQKKLSVDNEIPRFW